MYKKSPQLLASMALRASHDFGLKSVEERKEDVQEMDKLYDLYASGKTDIQIAEEASFYIVTVKQVREEVEGKGFFKAQE